MIDALATDLVFQPLRFSRNRQEVLIDPADTTLTDRSSLRYALSLLVPTFPQSLDFITLTTLMGRERPPQTVAGAVRYDGAQFRIDEVLDGFLETQKPAFRQAGIGVLPNLTMPYCLRETVTGGTPAVSATVNRPKQWVFKGGLSGDDFAGWQDGFFDRHLRDTRQFLTWQPPYKTVSAATQGEEYLYFMLNFTPVPAQVKLRCDVDYADGTSDTKTLLTLDRPSLYAVLSIPAGMATLNLAVPGKTVVRYRLWLTDQDESRLSEVRTYYVDGRVWPQERHLLIENSLGGYDTIRLLGQGDEATNVRRTVIETDRFGVNAIDVGTLRVVDVQGEQSLTVSTGYYERDGVAWARYLSEILYAKAIYLVTPKGHVPLVLTTTELPSADDDSDVVSRTLVFRRAKTETNYSQMPATAPAPARAVGWRGVGFRAVLDGSGKRTGLGTPTRLRQYYLDDGTNVKPITEKPNLPGDPDYIKPSAAPDFLAGTTPFPSAAINRTGSFSRGNCGAGTAGGPATISVPAARYGGEVPGDADALAEAEFRATNTQAYADQFGVCTAIDQNYTWSVPVGHWHYRANLPGNFEVYHKYNADADMGNAQAVQDRGGSYIFPVGSNDLDFPTTDKWWYYVVKGGAGQQVRVTVYQNGALVMTKQHTLNVAGYEIYGIMTSGEFSVDVTPVTGDKWYLKFEVV